MFNRITTQIERRTKPMFKRFLLAIRGVLTMFIASFLAKHSVI